MKVKWKYITQKFAREWLVWVCHIWTLWCWGMFPLCPLSGFYHKWVLNFVKNIFCIYWDNQMVFILQFVDVVFHTDWFVYIEKFLHPWDKSPLIMVYDPFNVLLNSVSTILLIFASMFMIYNFLFLLYLCLGLVSGWWWPHRMSLEVFLPLKMFGRVSGG